MGDDSDIDLAELDAMSSDEDDSSDEDVDEEEKKETPGALGSFMENQEKKRNKELQDYEGFEDGDDAGTVAEKMKTILALRASLGIDDDKSFMAEQERKDQEKKRLEKMSNEERRNFEEEKAGDVMARIRAKHAAKMKGVESRRAKEAAARRNDDGFADFGDNAFNDNNGAGPRFASFDNFELPSQQNRGGDFADFNESFAEDGKKKKKKVKKPATIDAASGHSSVASSENGSIARKPGKPRKLKVSKSSDGIEGSMLRAMVQSQEQPFDPSASPSSKNSSHSKPQKPRKLRATKSSDGEEGSMLEVLAKASMHSEDGFPQVKRKKKKRPEDQNQVPDQVLDRSASSSSLTMKPRTKPKRASRRASVSNDGRDMDFSEDVARKKKLVKKKKPTAVPEQVAAA